jgi:hypothetical protein
MILDAFVLSFLLMDIMTVNKIFSFFVNAADGQADCITTDSVKIIQGCCLEK